MSRPKKMRNVCSLPDNKRFGPMGMGKMVKEIISMTVDEYETIRLIDLNNFTQKECSEQMNIARTTVQGIYEQARVKLAESLINGKMIVIEGGDYRLCTNSNRPCGRGCRKEKLDNKKGDM